MGDDGSSARLPRGQRETPHEYTLTSAPLFTAAMFFFPGDAVVLCNASRCSFSAFSAARLENAELKAISRFCFQPHVSPLAKGGAVSNRQTNNTNTVI